MNDTPPPHTEGPKAGSVVGILALCLVFAVVVIILGVKIHNLGAQAADAQGQLAQAKTEATQAQSDLESAKAASAQLQSQLDKDKAQLAALQSQLDQDKAQLTDVSSLQSELAASKAQTADLQSEVAKAKAQTVDLQIQLRRANDGSSQLLTQLDEAKSHSMDLQARFDREDSALTRLQPLIEKARHMPVATAFEKSSWSSAFSMNPVYRLRIDSRSPDSLGVFITIVQGVGTRSQSGTIASGGLLTVDKLRVGDKVTIDSEGFDPVNLTVQ